MHIRILSVDRILKIFLFIVQILFARKRSNI